MTRRPPENAERLRRVDHVAALRQQIDWLLDGDMREKAPGDAAKTD